MMSNKGYISETTSTFQLGLRTSGQWVGEDILILNDLPFPFSIIAKTEVVALSISKQDLQSKVPSEFRHLLEENAKDRNKWLQKRIREITKTSQIIYQQDYKQTVYDKVLNQLITRHPQAISNALKSFTNHHVGITGMENSGKIMKQVSINHRKSDNQLLSSENSNSLIKTEANSLREGELYYKTKTQLVNKASFYPQPAKTSNEFQNKSMESAYLNKNDRISTAPYVSFNDKKKSIDLSFNNMKFKEFANGRLIIDPKSMSKFVNQDPFYSNRQYQSTNRPSTKFEEFTPLKQEYTNYQDNNSYRQTNRTSMFYTSHARKRSQIVDGKIRFPNACTFYPSARKRAKQLKLLQLIRPMPVK